MGRDEEQDLIFFDDAGRAVLKLPEDVQESSTKKLFLYGLTCQGDVKRLVGRGGLRLRDGDYRVIFEETATALSITSVGHRGSIYR